MAPVAPPVPKPMQATYLLHTMVSQRHGDWRAGGRCGVLRSARDTADKVKMGEVKAL